MDILSHALSGGLAASCVAAYTRKRLRQKLLLGLTGVMGAMIPDIDAVTLWSGFDGTVGAFLDLSASGRSIYFGNYFYSHHNMTHSLAAGIIATMVLGLLFAVSGAGRRRRTAPFDRPESKAGYLLAFFLGYVMHLTGDLPTPGYVWQGIKLFWPFGSAVGGTGHIWWWNNYDIFLLLLAGCVINLGILMVYRRHKKSVPGHAALLVALVVFSSAAFQATRRPIHFSYARGHSSHAENEQRSLELQRALLGDGIFNIMHGLDQRLKINF